MIEEFLSERVIFDFCDPAASAGWHPINDIIMGGRSESRLERSADGTVLFAGRVSLENNGGFASVRSPVGCHDLRGFSGVALRVCGDGKLYRLRLRTDPHPDGITYDAPFEPPAGIWLEVVIAFENFMPKFRGRRVPEAPALDLACVATFGLMIADKQEGAFALKLQAIRTCGQPRRIS